MGDLVSGNFFPQGKSANLLCDNIMAPMRMHCFHFFLSLKDLGICLCVSDLGLQFQGSVPCGTRSVGVRFGALGRDLWSDLICFPEVALACQLQTKILEPVLWNCLLHSSPQITCLSPCAAYHLCKHSLTIEMEQEALRTKERRILQGVCSAEPWAERRRVEQP